MQSGPVSSGSGSGATAWSKPENAQKHALKMRLKARKNRLKTAQKFTCAPAKKAGRNPVPPLYFYSLKDLARDGNCRNIYRSYSNLLLRSALAGDKDANAIEHLGR